MSEPPWRGEGFERLKLAYLAAQNGFFYDKYRALHDCHATLELLARPFPPPVAPPSPTSWSGRVGRASGFGRMARRRAQRCPPSRQIERLCEPLGHQLRPKRARGGETDRAVKVDVAELFRPDIEVDPIKAGVVVGTPVRGGLNLGPSAEGVALVTAF